MSPCVVEFVLSDSVGPSFERDDLLLGERAVIVVVVVVVCSLVVEVVLEQSPHLLPGSPSVAKPTVVLSYCTLHRLLPIFQAFQFL